MARKSKQEKRIDDMVEAAFYKHGSNIQFNIMDLGKIHKAGVDALLAGQDLDAAILAAIASYRQN